MDKFIMGIIVGLSILLIGATQIGNPNTKDSNTIYQDIINLYQNLNVPNYRVVGSTQIPTQMKEKEIVIYSSVTTSTNFLSLEMKYKGSTYTFTGARL